MAFPIPTNEAERLKEHDSLGVFDAAPLSELQALCEVAANVVRTPVALVSLVGAKEQKFAANFGLKGVTGTPRDVAFCAHTILTSEPFVVGDATKDDRFVANPLVTERPRIRSYAGIPLETSTGLRVGALCAVDFKRRRFSKRQVDGLRKLGLATARLLAGHRSHTELHKALADRAAKEETLRHAARHDALTGLANVSHFSETAIASLARLKSGRKAALILLDLDHFKTVNDNFGHVFGDTYLRAAAQAFQSVVRQTDCVGRLGGDEFGLLLSDLPSEREAINAAARIRSELRTAAIKLKRPELGKVSLGIALSPDHGLQYQELYKLADVALYAAKACGRNTFRVYDRSMGTGEDPRAYRAEVLDALERDEFVPYFQPQVDLKTADVVGLEVLARWEHPDSGLVSPSQFALAFDDPVAAPLLTRSMLRRALHHFAEWRRSGLHPGRLSFNATMADLQDGPFVHDFLSMLEQAAVSPRDLTIEVLETVVMGSKTENVYRSLEQLRELGVRVALDDFGVGYGGLQHLRSWPIDKVKIDRTFVADCVASVQDQLIVRSIISLSHQLGLRVVAEGIETRAQADLVAGFGCDIGQGYLFSRPLPASDIPQFIFGQAQRAPRSTLRGELARTGS